jgi:hypothetical protein
MSFLKAPLLALSLVLAGCGTFYPGEPMGSRPRFTAVLSGANEMPPAASAGRGSLTAHYLPSTRVLHWTLSFSDLSGPVTWAFLCGPDGVGSNDAELVPVNLQIEGGGHPGAVTLTERQAADLLAGRWYVNLKTERFPAGEIRGPLVPNAR